MSEVPPVRRAVYALIEALLDLGKTPTEIRHELGLVMAELGVAPVHKSPEEKQ